jgi:hypothetical protein
MEEGVEERRGEERRGEERRWKSLMQMMVSEAWAAEKVAVLLMPKSSYLSMFHRFLVRED